VEADCWKGNSDEKSRGKKGGEKKPSAKNWEIFEFFAGGRGRVKGARRRGGKVGREGGKRNRREAHGWNEKAPAMERPSPVRGEGRSSRMVLKEGGSEKGEKEKNVGLGWTDPTRERKEKKIKGEERTQHFTGISVSIGLPSCLVGSRRRTVECVGKKRKPTHLTCAGVDMKTEGGANYSVFMLDRSGGEGKKGR